MMLHWFLTTLANLIHAASPILKSYGHRSGERNGAFYPP